MSGFISFGDNCEIPVQFLLDTGASTSLFSIDSYNMEFVPSGNVMGVGGNQPIGKAIPCQIKFDTFSFSHSVKPVLLKGEKKLVILGRDFLSKFGLTTFDWANSKVTLGDELAYFLGDISERINPSRVGKLSEAMKSRFDAMINASASVFAHDPKKPRVCSQATHVIESMVDRPVEDKRRSVPHKWNAIINQQCDEMLKNGIIRASKSPYSHNVLLVDKKDGSKRFCIDFRSLNKNTKKDAYPIPNVDEMIEKFKGCKYFSQLDLASGYWGIALREEDKEKTAFTTSRQKYECNVMPFGLKNAGSTFQRTMNKVVQAVKDKGFEGIDAFQDNVALFTNTIEEHFLLLQAVFDELERFNMSLRTDKCEFLLEEMEFLGYIVSGNSVKPSSGNLEKVNLFPVPTTRKKLLRFLGMTNFNRRFIDKYAEVTRPLTKLTSPKSKYVWTNEQQVAFDKIKECLNTAQGLALPEWNKKFEVYTDASGVATGAMMCQELDKEKGQKANRALRTPLYYHSATLKREQTNWSTTDKEMWAIVVASRKWPRHCASEKGVVFYTDHQPLVHVRKKKNPTGKMARWLCELEDLDYEIKYVKGKKNEVADYLSRIEVPDVPSSREKDPDEYVYTVSIEELYPSMEILSKKQKEDKDIAEARRQLMLNKNIGSGTFKGYKMKLDTAGVVKKAERIVLPKSLKNRVIQEYHGQHHPGAENTIQLISQRFFWKGMRKDIETFVENCRTCSKCKNRPLPKAEMQIDNAVPAPRARLSMDVASMPMSPRGLNCFLVMVDANTKMHAVCCCVDQKAPTLERGLWANWFQYFGIPSELISDQGSNVDGTAIRELCKKLGIKKLRSSPYHPAGNGTSERTIGAIKTLVRSMLDSRKMPVWDWDLVIHEAVLASNNTLNKSMGFSPYQCTFGEHSRLPIDNFTEVSLPKESVDPKVIQANAEANRKEAKKSYKQTYDRNLTVNTFQVGDEVLMKRNHGKYPKINPKWLDGPLNTVVKKVGPVNYGIENSKGEGKVLHHNKLKPALSNCVASRTASSSPSAITNAQITGNARLLQVDSRGFTDNVFGRHHSEHNNIIIEYDSEDEDVAANEVVSSETTPVVNDLNDSDIIVNTEDVVVESESTILNNSVADMDNSLAVQDDEDLNVSNSSTNPDLDNSFKSVFQVDHSANSNGSLSPIDRIKNAIGRRFPRVNYAE